MVKKSFSCLLFILTLFILFGCEDQNGYREVVEITDTVNKDIYYGPDKEQVLDIIYPLDVIDSDHVLPVVLFIHGGGWISGDKSEFIREADDINQMGYIYASMNYHYASDDIHYETLIKDVEMAINFLYLNSEKLHVDKDGIALVGNSAGAHLAMLYAYKLNSASIKVKFVVSQVGPSDFTDDGYFGENMVSLGDASSKLLGKSLTEENFESLKTDQDIIDASPISHIDAYTVPTIMAYGKLDRLVPYSNAIRLDEKLSEFDIEHVFITYENSDHILGNPLDSDTKLLYEQTLYGYLDTYLPIRDYEN